MRPPSASLSILFAVLGACADGTGEPGPSPASEAPAGGDLDDLRALGYVDAGDVLADAAEVGALVHDPTRAAAGLTLVTNARLCRAELLDMAGEPRHAWSDAASARWDNTVLLPDGDLLVVGRTPDDATFDGRRAARFLMRLGWDGEVRWRRSLPVHHDAERRPSGDLASLTYERRVIESVHPDVPVNVHSLVVLSRDGELRTSLSLWDLLSSAPERFRFQAIGPRPQNGSLEVDLFHSNSVEWMRRPELAQADPLYGSDNVLVSIRHQDTLAIFDASKRELLWAWGQGELSGPHDATVLANGHVLVFDNGLSRGWSRVVEVDPRTNAIVWEYRGSGEDAFFTVTRGAAQRLGNGNTLVTSSEQGRVFEVTAAGEVVWSYRDPRLTEDGRPSVLVRARRLEGLGLDELQERLEEGRDLPWTD